MKLVAFLLLISFFSTAQETIQHEFESEILSENRNITIQLPESYGNSEKAYPVIYSLDGEYTKYTLNGTLNYYAFWKKIPECIIVSVDQNYMDTANNRYMRWLDCSYSWNSGFPRNKGIKFKKFISEELVSFMDKSYRTTSFKAIIGHSFTANYINYFLLDKAPIFNAYVAISPYYASNSLDSLNTVAKRLDKPTFYYVASGDKDLSGHIKSVKEFDKQFSQVDNEHFVYKSFDMENNQATHSTIVPIAMPDAMAHIFSLYSPISDEEFKRILKITDKVDYLKKRYESIQSVYGIEIPIREEDLNAIAYAAAKKKQWDQVKQIGELNIELYPESYSGYWTMGEYYEKTKNYESSLKQFEIGYSKLGEDVSNKSDFQEDIDRVKAKLK